ncbi:PLP-dependent aminotransferase family protein [Frondihabitans australicus]|uniref:GntR family transcriptional regulator n=1 Tax=Frondihabitans australicus TaxID=386892 RepID=A0A495IKM3_9MICO|nr:PLP-dependent aminotransferase family protein [Frondihabitans australicus]RKR76552.1 GntR family transcriptional regulator [Frondihabitans australicus]
MSLAGPGPFPVGITALVSLLGEWRHGGRAHAELAEKLQLLLIDGRLRSGSRLPAERTLAAALGVSRTTIVSAYSTLRERGVLTSIQGSGSILELPRGGQVGASVRPLSIDLSKAVPAPWPGLPAFAARALERLPEQMSRFGIDMFGLPDLRQMIADRYTRAGAPTSPDEILVTLGAQHAIGLVARAMLGRADRVLVESPTYPHALDSFRAAGARLVACPVGPSSIDPVDFEEIVRDGRPALAYLMPDFHNPTGTSMPDEARERLVAVAARTGTVLVIDETTADLDIDRPFTPTQFAAIPARGATVVTIGSLSKVVWSGLRIGWIRADRHVIDRIVAARPSSDMGNAIIEQLVAVEAMERFDEIRAGRRDELRVTRDRLVGLLRSRLPEWEVPDVDGGLALWVGLGAPLSSALALAARDQGVTITAGSRFGIDGAFERHIRIPITTHFGDLDDAVGRLARAWAGLGSPRSLAPETALVV